MTEFIPTLAEKRDSLIRDHFFNLLENLDERLGRLETEAGLPLNASHRFKRLLLSIRQEEAWNQALQGARPSKTDK